MYLSLEAKIKYEILFKKKKQKTIIPHINYKFCLQVGTFI